MKKQSSKSSSEKLFQFKAFRDFNKKHRSLSILWSKSTLGKTHRKHAEESFKIRIVLILLLFRDTESKTDIRH